MKPVEKWAQAVGALAVLGLGLLLSFAPGIFADGWFYALFLCGIIAIVSMILGYLVTGIFQSRFLPMTFAGLFGLLISATLFGIMLSGGKVNQAEPAPANPSPTPIEKSILSPAFFNGAETDHDPDNGLPQLSIQQKLMLGEQ